MRPWHHSARGFTLLEIIIALAILSTSLGAVSYAINQSSINHTYLKERTFAHWVAQNKTAELRLSPGQLQKSLHLSGRYPLANHNWYWSATATPTEEKALLKVVIAVAPERDSSSATTELTTYLPRGD